MATAVQVRDYRQAQADVVTLAERELTAFFAELNPNDNPKQAARSLEALLPDLVAGYGDIGAAIAADFYEDLREDSAVRLPTYNALMAPMVPVEQVQASTRWAVGPIFRETADVGAALSQLTDVSDRLIKQVGRNTITQNALRDPVKVSYARVPTGAETCKFCLMLASRGAVYITEQSASGANKYHGKCDCVPTPVWDATDLDRLKADSGYDPDALYQAYLDAE